MKIKIHIFRDKNGEIKEINFIESGDFGVAKHEQGHKIEAIGEVGILLEFFKENLKKHENLKKNLKKYFQINPLIMK